MLNTDFDTMGSRSFNIETHRRTRDGRCTVPLGVAGQQTLISGNSGAGEEIRTLDPNLGKVVLYH